jgi:tRNA(fMet)-specific endonuclease VapC
MTYMLDTNICIYIINNKPVHVMKKFLTLERNDRVCISTITVAELFYGLEKSQSLKKEHNRLALIKFLAPLEVMAFDEHSAIEYGSIRVALEKSGCVIGGNDLLIASHAKRLGCVLVTNNEREFRRVDGLSVENWV